MTHSVHVHPARRRVLAVLAAALLTLALLPPSPAAADAPEARGIDEACGAADLEAIEFDDIGGFAEPTQDAIACLAAYEITVGFGDGTYRPAEDVQRYQMALFLTRLAEYVVSVTDLELPEEIPDAGFDDIDDLSDEAQGAINTLAALDITQGTTEDTFSPNDTVTRRDLSSFLVRLQDVIEEGSYATDAEDVFADVPADLDRAGDINALAEQGIVGGGADGTFDPFGNVRRAEMALFLMRHLDENVDAGRAPAGFTSYEVALSWLSVVDDSGDEPAYAAGEEGASGTLGLTVDLVNDGLVWNIDAYNVSAPQDVEPDEDTNLGPLHLHAADVDATGPPVVVLGGADADFDTDDGVLSVSGTEDAEAVIDDDLTLVDLVTAPEGLYANLHTEQAPAGAVRGQLPTGQFDHLPDEVFDLSYEMTLTADAVVDGGDEGASGTLSLDLDGSAGEADWALEADGLSSQPFDVEPDEDTNLGPFHIHTAMPGANGPPVVILGGAEADFDFDDGAVSQSGTITAEDILDEDLTVKGLAIAPHLFYANLHTEEHPAGAIRGQLSDSVIVE